MKLPQDKCRHMLSLKPAVINVVDASRKLAEESRGAVTLPEIP
jgi:hypothetical protein